MINKLPIKISLVESNIHKHMLSTLPQIWKTSRPNVDLNLLKASDFIIDTQIMDFPTMSLEMRLPVFLRDIILGDRTHVAWARTTRVDDIISNLNIIETNDEAILELAIESLDAMISDQLRGVTQDVYRAHLPMTYMTTLTVQLSLRSWIKMIHKLEAIAGYGGENHEQSKAQLMCESVSGQIGAAIASVLPIELKLLGVQLLMDRIKPPKFTWGYDQNWYKQGVTESSVTLNMLVSYSLRAQIIRHRAFTVYDNYELRCLNDGLLQSTIGDQIPITIVTDYESMRGIVESRNCWLADSRADMWGSIVDKVNNLGSRPLPCDGGSCPFSGDCDQRITGEDPGVPCPIHAANNFIDEDLGKLLDGIKNDMNRMNFTDDAHNFWSNKL